MAAKSSDELFWKAYMQIIGEAAGAKFNSNNNAIFYSTKVQSGPWAESAAPYYNMAIYNIANNLLPPDNLFYSPAATKGYFGSLKSYLAWVDIGGNSDNAHIAAVTKAKSRVDDAEDLVNAEQDKAYAKWQKQAKMGLISPDMTFTKWLPNNAPSYTNALNTLQAANGQYRSAQADLNGPLGSQWAQDSDHLDQASKRDGSNDGYNMPVTNELPPIDLIIAGKTPPAPTGIYWVPAYTCPDYPTAVKDWEANATKKPTFGNPHVLDLKNAKDMSDSSFNQTKITGGLDVSYVPFISFGANASHEEKEEELTTQNIENDIKVEMFWDDMKAVTINPGAGWNVSDPRGTYQNLKDGAPKSVKYLARPSQMIIANKIGYKVTFNSSIKDTFDRKVSSATSGGGYVRIFGIPIGFNAGGSNENSHTTHTGSWDSSSGVFTVEAKGEYGFANVVAMVGEIVKTF